MSGRISLQQAFSQGLRGILNVQSQLFKTQDQVSSGKRVLTPADDPIAAARILQLEQATADTAQYQKNIDGAQTALSGEDTQLDAISNLLTRVRELAVTVGNGAYTQEQRQATSAELKTRLDELVSLANTRTASGEYMFGGYQGQQAPFVKGANGNYVYRGDDGQRLVQVSATTAVPMGDSGQDVFVAIASTRLPTSVAATNTGNATIAMGQIADKAAFNTQFVGPYTVTISTAGPTPTYQIDTVPATVPIATGDYVSGQAIQFNGAQIDIVGNPGNGDTFTVRPPATQNVLDTVAKLANSLEGLSDSPDDQLRLRDLVSESLDNIDAAEANISTVRARVGARQNTLDSIADMHQGVDVVNQKVLGDVRDLDYAEAVTRLTKEQTILQAAQQSFANISKLSLFDFIR